jgi:hypothetical protein
MNILKLIFHHDLQIESLGRDNPERPSQKDKEMSLDDFMKPIPTFSRFYLTNTDLGESREDAMHGINTHPEYQQIIKAVVDEISGLYADETDSDKKIDYNKFLRLIDDIRPGNGVDFLEALLGNATNEFDREKLYEAQSPLETGRIILFKEKAHHGFDLHMFTRRNLYESWFKALKPFIGSDSRFFSINGKRVGSERTFYFETYRLQNPPHGFEEVFPETKLFGEK